MGKKPTYEELERRIREFEKKALEQGLSEKRLRLLPAAVEHCSE